MPNRNEPVEPVRPVLGHPPSCAQVQWARRWSWAVPIVAMVALYLNLIWVGVTVPGWAPWMALLGLLFFPVPWATITFFIGSPSDASALDPRGVAKLAEELQPGLPDATAVERYRAEVVAMGRAFVWRDVTLIRRHRAALKAWTHARREWDEHQQAYRLAYEGDQAKQVRR